MLSFTHSHTCKQTNTLLKNPPNPIFAAKVQPTIPPTATFLNLLVIITYWAQHTDKRTTSSPSSMWVACLPMQQELGHIWQPPHPACPPSPCSAAPQWLCKIFMSILIVFFHSLSSEVNAVMSDYSKSHASSLLLFTEGTGTLARFCLDPRRAHSELLIVCMLLTSSHSLHRQGSLAWHGMETARLCVSADKAQTLCCTAKKKCINSFIKITC